MSEIRANTFSDSAGTGPAALMGQWAARGFVNYNQVTPAVLKSGNVSSVTDNTTGTFTVNHTASFSDALYAFAGSTESIRVAGVDVNNDPTTSAFRGITTQSNNNFTQDRDFSSFVFVGDLA